MKIAIYPGSFNPFHNGHISIVEKAIKIFDLIYIIITKNPDKKIFNNFVANQTIIKNYFKNNKKIIVLINKIELTAILAKKLGATFIIRGSRSKIDFDYELNLANSNNFINNKLETIILFSNYNYKNVSSTIIRHKKIMESD